MWPYPQETAGLVTFTEKILNGKLYFLCAVLYNPLIFVFNVKPLILALTCQTSFSWIFRVNSHSFFRENQQTIWK